MKRFVCSLIAFAMVAAFAPASLAQAPEGVMVSIVETHVKPGMALQFEAARKAVVANWTKDNFSYAVSESRGDGSIYRRTTVVESLTDLDRAVTENSGLGPIDRSMQNRMNEAVDHISNTIVRTRPELFYTPENPRLSGDEVGLYHYVFLYPRSGTRRQMTQAITKYRDLWAKHNERDGFIVAGRCQQV